MSFSFKDLFRKSGEESAINRDRLKFHQTNVEPHSNGREEDLTGSVSRSSPFELIEELPSFENSLDSEELQDNVMSTESFPDSLGSEKVLDGESIPLRSFGDSNQSSSIGNDKFAGPLTDAETEPPFSWFSGPLSDETDHEEEKSDKRSRMPSHWESPLENLSKTEDPAEVCMATDSGFFLPDSDVSKTPSTGADTEANIPGTRSTEDSFSTATEEQPVEHDGLDCQREARINEGSCLDNSLNPIPVSSEDDTSLEAEPSKEVWPLGEEIPSSKGATVPVRPLEALTPISAKESSRIDRSFGDGQSESDLGEQLKSVLPAKRAADISMEVAVGRQNSDRKALGAHTVQNKVIDFDAVIRHCTGLPGVKACVLQCANEALKASSGAGEFLGYFNQKVVASMRNLASALNVHSELPLTIYCEEGLLSFFDSEVVWLGVLYEASGFEAGVQEKLISVFKELTTLSAVTGK